MKKNSYSTAQIFRYFKNKIKFPIKFLKKKNTKNE